MSEPAICLKPINDLLPESFVVPSYQRGYRWKKQQVAELLNDIWEFETGETTAKFYCLQPLVVQRRPDGRWDIIDGQQRLTTIYLILKALDRQMELFEKQSFTLHYATREATSGDYLRTLDQDRRDENIDFHHLYEAYETIEEWFRPHDTHRKRKFLECLTNDDASGRNVKVIWYELPEEIGGQNIAIDAFTRLNAGKIPLTNSELIRALFLSARPSSAPTAALEQSQLAQEWYSIETALQRDEFWYFLHSGKQSPPSRIEYLFELMAREEQTVWLPDNPYRTFHFFQDQLMQGPLARDIWLEIKRYFMTLEEWFNDPVFYHLIGYLVHQNDDLLELRRLGKGVAKSAFAQVLRERIYRQVLKLPVESLHQPADTEEAIGMRIESVDYEHHAASIRALLLLFNVASILKNPHANLRFPFYRYKKDDWDIEHVRSVADDKPSRDNDRSAWLKVTLDYLQGHGIDGALQRELVEVFESGDVRQRFDQIYEKVRKRLEGPEPFEPDNGLGNLTLLNARTNRSYKNAVYPVKRDRILLEDREGSFVPLGTRNLFLKSYSQNLGQMLIWSGDDARDYRAAIVKTLVGFFHSEGEHV